MNIVINIPEELYNRYMNYTDNYVDFVFIGTEKTIIEAIRKGTPLPKEHGRLIDADYAIKQLSSLPRNELSTPNLCATVLELVPTIIEADKESD